MLNVFSYYENIKYSIVNTSIGCTQSVSSALCIWLELCYQSDPFVAGNTVLLTGGAKK